MNVASAEGVTSREFQEKLELCVQAALPPNVLDYGLDWTTHVFRRGSTVDILQTQGVSAMMRHGESCSEASARSYATSDEIDTAKLREACISMIDLSDDDP